ncbi:LysR family transcriptional regulator [Roseivivax sediminis]|uniref:LysR family transcriptional regulator, glycine cleavage system transcriptional activator n=1 Tax=Roseivivax sediminis TaxID=936889 RepID=A0A1I2AWI6_9RHOB|nr:LysR family transcriptional regulator [Roseivivax sediminis]SFE48099.1 LysR family transcriptional regulator, glycine cleavage system transcriptional activator [Roseivivax sediminis]
MPFSRLPPLSALRAFSAFAETGSVTRAGAILNVSHAAVSQQLRNLETHLGVKLLDRSGNRLALTPEGSQLADTLIAAFGRIAQTVDALTGADADRPLHVSTSPSFASNWLMPRLAGFRTAHPEIDIMIDPTPRLNDPEPGGIDVAIRYGEAGWPGLESEPLMSSPIWIVAAPELIGDLKPERPEDLLGFPWLQELGTTEASNWFAQHGITKRLAKGIIHVPGNLMLDGARNGQGIVVTSQVAVERDVDAGRLRLLFEERAGGGYHIVTAPGAVRPQLRAFVTWLRREAARDRR